MWRAARTAPTRPLPITAAQRRLSNRETPKEEPKICGRAECHTSECQSREGTRRDEARASTIPALVVSTARPGGHRTRWLGHQQQKLLLPTHCLSWATVAKNGLASLDTSQLESDHPWQVGSPALVAARNLTPAFVWRNPCLQVCNLHPQLKRERSLPANFGRGGGNCDEISKTYSYLARA